MGPKGSFQLTGDYRPWSSQPVCISSKDSDNLNGEPFCLFADRVSGGGHGLVLFTTPAVTQQIAQANAYKNHTVYISAEDTQIKLPFEYRTIPGKDLGVVANQTLLRGANIIQASPPWAFSPATIHSLGEADRISMQWHGLWTLPPSTREEFLALHKFHDQDEIDDVMLTNAFSTSYTEKNVPR